MFLEDSFSVARILILFFFIALVLLATILDISGVVENRSCDPRDNEMSMTEEIAEESSQGTGEAEHVTIQSVLQLKDIESPNDPSMDISRSPEEKDHCDKAIFQENIDPTQESMIADKMSEENEAKTFQEERKKKSYPALSPTEDNKSISRLVNHQATTVRLEEHGIMRVLADAGYRAMAVNILGEMGLDHMDGAESSEDGGLSKDDIICAGSSRWPGPDHRPDLTSLSWASAGTGYKCQAGEACTGQAIGTRDIGIVIPEKNKVRSEGQKDSLILLLQAFSIKRNLPKIFNITGSSEGDLSCVHGIRFLSMTWVILGHTFYFSLPYVDNPVWALNIINNSWTMEAVEQGLFSVDSFFFLSGLLVSYIFLRRWSFKEQLTSPLTWFKVILHRYVRLLPPYIALVLLIEPLSFYTCSGPQVCIRGNVRQHF